MLTDKKLSVVVPCYNDEPNILELVRQLKETLAHVTQNWEIVYVNDSSPGNAAEVLSQVASEDKRIIVVNFSRNFGVMSAFHAGMTIASGDAVIIMDGDLQDPPSLIPDFVKKWNAGFKVVYGIRKTRDEVWYRKVGYKLFYKFWRIISDVEMPSDAGEYALLDRRVVEIITSMPERDRFLRGIRTWVGFPQVGIPYHRVERYAGESTQTLLSYVGWSLKAISGFSVKPLRMVFFMALTISIVFMCLLGYNLSLYMGGAEAPPGFFTLLSVGLFGSISQLLALAIISEYLIHIMQEVKGRPHYIIESTANLPENRVPKNVL
jgi:dolichol-phosphate mannosyltransferase